jgi:hypothetical protein
MSEMARIVQLLKEAHDGEAWHGPSVNEALDGVTASQAVLRPVPGGHCIAELVHHIRVVDELVRRRLTGDPPTGEPQWEPLVVPPLGDSEWQRALDRLHKEQEALRQVAAGFPPSRLHDVVPGQDGSYWQQLLGVLQHDLYHAGQISLLKKALAAR